MPGVKREDVLVWSLGWIGPILQGDVTMFDRWRWLHRRLRRGPLRTLDAGSGSGAFSFYAAKLGNEVVGISFDAHNNAAARRRACLLGLQNVRFVQGDLRRLDEFAPELGRFDQVICQETIEHIHDDAKLVRDLANALRPGGRLFLTTPNVSHRPTYRELIQHNWREDGGHVRYGYSHAHLREMVEAAGLVVVEQGYVSGALSQWTFSLMAWLALRARIPLRLAWGLTFPLRVLQPFDRPFTELLGYEFSSVAVVALCPTEEGAQRRGVLRTTSVPKSRKGAPRTSVGTPAGYGELGPQPLPVPYPGERETRSRMS